MTEPDKQRGTMARQWRAYFVAAALTAFATNLGWEMTQMRAYRELDTQPWWQTLAGCTGAALADVLLTFLPYGLVAAVSRDARWAWRGGVTVYATLAALGFVTAVIGEYIGLQSGKWSYNEQMPVVPIIEAGAWPVLQLTLLVPLAFAAGNIRRRRASR